MKRVKFVLNDNEIKEGILEEDNMFWGGFKIIHENSIFATSQCCGVCGKLSKTYVDREKECDHCKIKINRDINGARNILLKNYKEVINI